MTFTHLILFKGLGLQSKHAFLAIALLQCSRKNEPIHTWKPPMRTSRPLSLKQLIWTGWRFDCQGHLSGSRLTFYRFFQPLPQMK